jgi:hypothetical protein
MTEFTYPPRVYLLLAAFGVMTVVYATARLGEAASYQDPYPFRTQYARLQGVKTLISGQQRVGYVTNMEQGRQGYAQLYFPTQYVLAPTLLVPEGDKTSFEYVLGNFTKQQDYAEFGRSHGLDLVREFPMGVVLYRRRAEGDTPAREDTSPAP